MDFSNDMEGYPDPPPLPPFEYDDPPNNHVVDDGMPNINLVDEDTCDPLVAWAAAQPTHQVQTADVQFEGIRFEEATTRRRCHEITQRYPNDLHFVAGCGNLTNILDNDVFYPLLLAFYAMGVFFHSCSSGDNRCDASLLEQLRCRVRAAGCQRLDTWSHQALERLVKATYGADPFSFHLHGGRDDTEPLVRLVKAYAAADPMATSRTYRLWTVPEVQDGSVKKKSRYPSMTQEQWDQGTVVLQEMTDNLALLKKRLSSPMRQAHEKIVQSFLKRTTITRNAKATPRSHKDRKTRPAGTTREGKQATRGSGKAVAAAKSMNRKRKSTPYGLPSPPTLPTPCSPEIQLGKRAYQGSPRSPPEEGCSSPMSWQALMQRYLLTNAVAEPDRPLPLVDESERSFHSSSWQSTLPASLLPHSQGEPLPHALEQNLDAALRVDGSVVALQPNNDSEDKKKMSKKTLALLAIQFARVWVQQDPMHRFACRIDVSTPEACRQGCIALTRHLQQPWLGGDNAGTEELPPQEAGGCLDKVLSILQSMSRQFQWILILDHTGGDQGGEFFSAHSQWWNTRGRFLLVTDERSTTLSVQSLGLDSLPQTEPAPIVHV